jgi:hypothetical protein
MALIKLNNSSLSAVTSAGIPIRSNSVLQVKQSVMTTSLYEAGSMVHLSDLDVNITPTASNSKFLIRGQICISSLGTRYHTVKLYKRVDGVDTQISKGDKGSASNRTEAWLICGTGEGTNREYEQNPVFGEFLDAPNTTDAITYRVLVGTHASSGYAFTINSVAYNNGNYDANWNTSPISVLTVMEIAG